MTKRGHFRARQRGRPPEKSVPRDKFPLHTVPAGRYINTQPMNAVPPAPRHVSSEQGKTFAKPPVRGSSREAILDAAETVALASGAVHLTLDAVAERAGVSKGGLLYNFPSKEALLQAMVDRNMRRLGQDHAAALAHFPPVPGRELMAFVHMTAQKSMCCEKRLGGSLLAACANNPRLLEPVHRFHRWRLEMIDAAARDGLPFERAAIASLALDGLCLLEMLGLSPFSPEQRARILEDLQRFIDELAAVR